MSISYDTSVRPTNPAPKIHEGRYAHDRLPARPCADTPAWHLRNNNLLGLHVAFQCGTIHHNCLGVSLAKLSDNPNPNPFPFAYTRLWKDTVGLAIALDKIFPPDRANAVYSGLADNDLSVFRYFLRKQANPQERC